MKWNYNVWAIVQFWLEEEKKKVIPGSPLDVLDCWCNGWKHFFVVVQSKSDLN